MRDLMHEHSGFFEWGLQLFNGDPINSGYQGEIVHHSADDVYNEHYQEHYDTDCSHTDCNHLENDEIIARTLQDDFSQLTVSEASGYSHVVEDHYQASNLEHDWRSPSTMNYHCSDYNHGQEETDDAEPSTSCSSPGDREEYPYSPELTEEYLLDQMIPIPHVPRINGEIPSSDEATSDHQRLLGRLQTYDFVERTIQGDGNCQFRALSDQLYQTPDNHKFVRQQVVSQLRSNPEVYEGYVPMQYEDYLERMSESGEWGDHVTLQAAADSFGVKIFVVTSFKDTCCIEILPNFQKPKRVIFLSFWAEVHYNSINPRGGLPSNESRKRKKWWIFGNKN
ncbi:OVARIAN TUMOR DOMAIN-containing deubiquitinating enzyme 12-like isoform X1 [Quercus lobata]|uniref:OVARIAN TUMOR DOMAIN-containing deubiquitinating enzyme 12-like isoform X1 n=1 Tax=Quercus lobata TaxID=97700 RepID=UPI0012492C39|nr:OVARIAN TUMOR DOMAIN-containing deubiquitinating enzyme 12-like isoform X1 [Quercus lobata]XP_030927366.1 OVARIAN TUMOR DOMAIN-containing deubiquitinating enzyme 12-like isoform X1 [Quercus lobata]